MKTMTTAGIRPVVPSVKKRLNSRCSKRRPYASPLMRDQRASSGIRDTIRRNANAL
jgi:hypothetical protein